MKKATVWFVENKDKTFDDILGMALNEQLILKVLTFSSLVLFKADPVSQPVEGEMFCLQSEVREQGEEKEAQL